MNVWVLLNRPIFDVTNANRNIMKSITVILSYLLHIRDLLTLVIFSISDMFHDIWPCDRIPQHYIALQN